MRTFFVLALALSVAATPVFAQVSIEEIEKNLTAQWDKLESLSGVYELTASFKLKPEQTTPMKLVGGGTVDYAKVGGAPRYKGFLWAGFSPTGRLLQAQALYDGQAGYYEALAPLFKLNASGKATMADIVQPGGKPLFDAMRKHLANITALGEEQVGGVDCFAIKAAPKDAKSPVASVVACFAKATGMLHRITLFDAAGTQMAVVLMKDVKVNGGIAAETFNFVSLAPPPAPEPAPAPKE